MPTPLLVMVLLLLAIAGLVYLRPHLRQRRWARRNALLQKTAAKLGLEWLPPTAPDFGTMRRGDGTTIRVVKGATGEKDVTSITAKFAHPFDFPVRIGPGGDTRLKLAVKLRSGDTALDKHYDLTAPTSDGLLFLDPAIQEGLGSLLTRLPVRWHRAQFVLTGPETLTFSTNIWLDHIDPLSETIRRVLGLVDAIQQGPPDIPSRLAAMARTHPDSELRKTCLRALLDDHPTTQAAREATELVLASNDPAMRLKGAIVLGAEGIQTVKSLLEAHTLPRVDAARALAHLVSQGPDQRAWAAPRLVALASEVLDTEEEAAATWLIKGMCTLADPVVESGLIHLLDHPTGAIRLEAVAALATFGTLAAIMPLKKHANMTSARNAIATIRRRVGGPTEPGQLALTAPTDAHGGLSAPQQTGALSVEARATTEAQHVNPADVADDASDDLASQDDEGVEELATRSR